MSLAFYLLLIRISFVEVFISEPMYFDLGEKWKQATSQEQILAFPGKDSLSHQLYLAFDQKDSPLFFYAYIHTPVCIDNVCKPVEIDLYWNLVGHYVGYGVNEKEPLTKYDHEPFLKEDYDRLHKLLKNPHSILERKTLDDLFDPDAKPEKAITFQGVEVDAVSGATKAEIKSSVVEGALYSCFTLWHLAHGAAKDSIKNYLSTNLDSVLLRQLLYSQDADYQLFALRNMRDLGMIKESNRILEVFENARPLTRTYILKKLPENLWKSSAFTVKLYSSFADVDINTRTLLLKKLSTDYAFPMEILSEHVKDMTLNQLKIYLSFLETNKALITDLVVKNMRDIIDSQTYVYSYLISEFLEERK